MVQHYSQAFKEQAVKKSLLRAKNASIRVLSSDPGVSHSSLQDWISKMGRTGAEKQMTKEKKPTDGQNQLPKLITGIKFKDGIEMENNDYKNAA